MTYTKAVRFPRRVPSETRPLAELAPTHTHFTLTHTSDVLGATHPGTLLKLTGTRVFGDQASVPALSRLHLHTQTPHASTLDASTFFSHLAPPFGNEELV